MPISLYNLKNLAPFVMVLMSLIGCTLDVKINDTSANSKAVTSPDNNVTLNPPIQFVISTNQTAFPINGSCKNEGQPVEIYVSAVVLSSATCVSGNWNANLDLTTQPEGVIDIKVRITKDGKTSETPMVQIKKDLTSPDMGGVTLTDGVNFNSLVATPNLIWLSAADPISGIDRYEIAIGSFPGGQDVKNWTDVGLLITSNLGGLSLTDATTYYAVLRAVDCAGNISAEVQSDGWLVDATAPVAGSFSFDGIVNFSSTNSPDISWTVATDVGGTGISHYEISIGDSLGGTNILPWTNVGLATAGTWSALSLNGSQRYYPNLRAIDNAGNITSAINGDGWWNLKSSRVAVDVTNPIPRTGSYQPWFGSNIDVSPDGTLMAVSAPDDSLDSNGENFVDSAGAVFIFRKTLGSWVLEQKITPTGLNARSTNDAFGLSVAISNDTLVVGESNHEYDENGNNLLTNAGAVYVFIKTAGGWVQQQKIVAQGVNARNAGDYFGLRVSLSGETLVATSNNGYDKDGLNFLSYAGAAFVYKRTAGVWNLEEKLVPSGLNARNASDYFGRGVSIDSDTVAIGASGHDYDAAGGSFIESAGAIFVFTRTGAVWTQQQKLSPTGTGARISYDGFGSVLKINSDTIAVGVQNQDTDAAGGNTVNNAGAVFVFKRTTGVWSQEQKIIAKGLNGRILGDFFGWCLDIENDTLVVGAINQSYDANGANFLSTTGTLYIYSRSGSTWSYSQRLTAFGPNGRATAADFAINVAIGGNTIASGAPQHRYDTNGLNDIFRSGAAFTFELSGSWINDEMLIDSTIPGDRMDLFWDGFGESIAISEDGTTMVVGSPGNRLDASDNNYLEYAGAAYVYIKSGSNWVFQQKLVATGLNARVDSGSFGNDVAISGDTIAVNAYSDDYDSAGGNFMDNAGAVYVFTRTAGVWSLQQKLVEFGTNGRASFNHFGSSISIDGDTLVAGSPFNDTDENGLNSVFNSGAVYTFVRNAGVWSNGQKIIATGLNARMSNDKFGNDVSVKGNRLVVGASLQDYDSAGGNFLDGAGAIYVFEKPGLTWSQTQKIVASGLNGRNASDFFGGNVSLNNSRIAVSAGTHDYDSTGANLVTDAGAVFIYKYDGANFSLEQKITPTGTNARFSNDAFGTSLSLSSDVLVVGSQNDYDQEGSNLITNSGSAFLYSFNGTNWIQSSKLTGSGLNGRNSGDNFGYSVSISENGAADGYTIGVGATGNSYSSTGDKYSDSAGAAFVFH